MDDGEGMGPVGCGEEGKRKQKQKKKRKRKQKKDEEAFFGFHHRSCLGYSYSAAVPKRRFLMDGDIGCTRRSSWR